MTTPTTPANNCDDKLAFDSKEQAEATAATAEWQHGTKLKVYQCKNCSLFHLATDYDN